MKEIPLVGSDSVAIVDDEDCENVTRHKWRLTHDGFPIMILEGMLAKRVGVKNVFLAVFVRRCSARRSDITHKNGNKLDCRTANVSVRAKMNMRQRK